MDENTNTFESPAWVIAAGKYNEGRLKLAGSALEFVPLDTAKSSLAFSVPVPTVTYIQFGMDFMYINVNDRQYAVSLKSKHTNMLYAATMVMLPGSILGIRKLYDPAFRWREALKGKVPLAGSPLGGVAMAMAVYCLIMVALILPAYFTVPPGNQEGIRIGIIVLSLYFFFIAVAMLYAHYRMERGSTYHVKYPLNKPVFALTLFSVLGPWAGAVFVYRGTSDFWLVMYVYAVLAAIFYLGEYLFLSRVVAQTPLDLPQRKGRLIFVCTIVTLGVLLIMGGGLFLNRTYTGTIERLSCVNDTRAMQKLYGSKYVLVRDFSDYNPLDSSQPTAYYLGDDTDGTFDRYYQQHVKVKGTVLDTEVTNLCGAKTEELSVLSINPD